MTKFENTALIIVDVQNDFVFGSLATDVNNDYMKTLAGWLKDVKNDYSLIATTQDWHVSDDTEHIEQWGKHCMAYSDGANLHSDLVKALDGVNFVKFHKGHHDHGYSGFEGIIKGAKIKDNHPEDQLAYFLKRLHGIDTVHIVGIATEHCVRATALDSVNNGFKTVVFSNYVNAVDKSVGKDVLDNELPNNNVEVV